MDDVEFSCSSKALSFPMVALQTGVLMLKGLMLLLLHLLSLHVPARYWAVMQGLDSFIYEIAQF